MDQLLDFNNKTVLITGATGGFGQLLARGFAQRGANLLLTDLNSDKLNELTTSLLEFGGKYHSMAADISQEHSHIKLCEYALETFGGLYLAINNAGIAQAGKPLHTMSDADIDPQLNVNLKSVFYGMKHQVSAMLKSSSLQPQGGHILNVSSIAGTEAAPSVAGYSAAKHGVIGLTKTAAVEYARHNIRINAACPFLSPTPLVKDGFAEHFESAKKQIAKRCPMNRIGEPEEMVNAMILMCSPANTFLNGQALIIDGGVSAY